MTDQNENFAEKFKTRYLSLHDQFIKALDDFDTCPNTSPEDKIKKRESLMELIDNLIDGLTLCQDIYDPDFKDEDDEDEPIEDVPCTYKFTKGKRKGEECGKIACQTHQKKD